MATTKWIRKSGDGRCRPPVVLLFLAILAPLLFLSSRISGDQKGMPNLSCKQISDWREQLDMQHLRSILTKEVINYITTSRDDLEPWSLDLFRRNYVSSSWQVVGANNAAHDNLILANITSEVEHKSPEVKLEESTKAGYGSSTEEGLEIDSDDQHELIDLPAKLARRHLREKRREKRVQDLVHKDDEAIVKLENAAIEHSKAVDSAVLGKYSIWRKENENDNSDSTVRLMRDQIIMARVYSVIAKTKSKLDLYQDLLTHLKENQHALGEAITDADLNHSAHEKIKAMGAVSVKS